MLECNRYSIKMEKKPITFNCHLYKQEINKPEVNYYLYK